MKNKGFWPPKNQVNKPLSLNPRKKNDLSTASTKKSVKNEAQARSGHPLYLEDHPI